MTLETNKRPEPAVPYLLGRESLPYSTYYERLPSDFPSLLHRPLPIRNESDQAAEQELASAIHEASSRARAEENQGDAQGGFGMKKR